MQAHSRTASKLRDRADRLRPVTSRTLDWTPTAPVRITATIHTDAHPAAVFDVLTHNEGFPDWFPGVKAVHAVDSGQGVGGSRLVRIPGATVAETFVAWDHGRRWAFTATAARPRFFRSLVEECLIDLVDGGTSITYTAYVDPAPAARPLITVFAPLQRANLRRALTNLAAIATEWSAADNETSRSSS